MADKYQALVSGKTKLKEATTTSTGATEAGDIVALDASGKLDASLLPVGVGPDVKLVEASEAISAGDYVNLFDDAGTVKVRLADNSNGREAHGWVKAAFAPTETATVYFEGPNEDVASGTAGQRAYLGETGAVLTSPLDSDLPANVGKIHQYLGTYIDTNSINTDIADCIEL